MFISLELEDNNNRHVDECHLANKNYQDNAYSSIDT